jgi:hypothetical protein
LSGVGVVGETNVSRSIARDFRLAVSVLVFKFVVPPFGRRPVVGSSLCFFFSSLRFSFISLILSANSVEATAGGGTKLDDGDGNPGTGGLLVRDNVRVGFAWSVIGFGILCNVVEAVEKVVSGANRNSKAQEGEIHSFRSVANGHPLAIFLDYSLRGTKSEKRGYQRTTLPWL